MRKYSSCGFVISLFMGGLFALSAAPASASSSGNWGNDLLFQDLGQEKIKVTPRPKAPRDVAGVSRESFPSVAVKKVEPREDPWEKRKALRMKKKYRKKIFYRRKILRKKTSSPKFQIKSSCARKSSCAKIVSCQKVVRCCNQTKSKSTTISR